MKSMRNIFLPLDWCSAFKGQCCVYLLKWSDRLYVGSTISLFTRVCSWRVKLPPDAEIKILCTCTEADRFSKEAAFIKQYDTYCNGHNKTENGQSGGVVGRKSSESAKDKIRQHKLTLYKDPAKNPMYGRMQTEQARAKIAAALKGVPFSSARKAAISAGCRAAAKRKLLDNGA